MRIFVAVVPPVSALEHLEEFLDVRRDAGRADGLRWAQPDAMHLTTAFAAEAREGRVEDLIEQLETVASRHRRVDLRITGGGAFPHAAAARVLWAGVSAGEPAEPAPQPDPLLDPLLELDRLAARSRTAMSRVGIEVDGSRFRPHLTVARTSTPLVLDRWVRLMDTYVGPSWPLTSVRLVQSHLHGGARGRRVYETLAEAEVGGRGVGASNRDAGQARAAWRPGR